MPARGFEAERLGELEAAVFRLQNQCPSQGVLRAFFHGSAQNKQFIRAAADWADGQKVQHRRFAQGNGAGLVQQNRVDGAAVSRAALFLKRIPFSAPFPYRP